MIGAEGKNIVAKRILQIAVYQLPILREPIARRVNRLKFLVVAQKRHTCDQGRAVTLTPKRDQQAYEQLSEPRRGLRSTRTAKDGGSVIRRIARHNLAHDKGAHAVTKQDQGEVGVLLFHKKRWNI